MAKGIKDWDKESHARFKKVLADDPVPDVTTAFRRHKSQKPASKKVLMDRLTQARKDLLRQIEWYEDARGREARRNPGGRFTCVTFYSWIVDHHRSSWSWYVKIYEKALNACLEAGIEVRA